MKKSLLHDEARDKTRILKGRSLLSIAEAWRRFGSGDQPKHPYLLTSKGEEIQSFYWTLALPVRKKTPEERGADQKKTLELSERLQAILLDNDYVYVGRSRENDITLTPKSVSRLHACFSLREGSWVVTDIGSANGTMVDGRLLNEGQTAPLANLAKISFGPDAVFYFASSEDVQRLAEKFIEHSTLVDTSDRIELPKQPATRRQKQPDPSSTSTLDGLVSALTVSTANAYETESAAPGCEDTRLESSLAALEAMFALVAQVSVVLTIKDQTVVVYDATDSPSQPKDLRASIWPLRSMIRSVNVALSSGDRRPFEIYTRSS